MMKKITFLHYAYPPKIGGVEKILREHAIILAKFGYQVSVLTGFGLEEHAVIHLVVHKHLQALKNYDGPLHEKLMTGEIPPAFYTLSKKIELQLTKDLEDQDVVIVHNMLTLIHNLPFIHAFYAWRQKHLKKKVLVWVHDQTYVDNGKVVWNKEGVTLAPELKQLLVTPLVNTKYILISKTFEKLLHKIMPLKLGQTQVIPNGVYIKRFLEIDPIIWNFMQSYHLELSFPIILAPGNLLERKNLIFSLEIVAELAKKYKNVKFIMSGQTSVHRKNNNYFEVLKKKVEHLGLSKQVIFLGENIKRALIDSELHDLYALSDMVFFFSRQENFGLPLLEAALTKTPLFVSDLPVFHEIGNEYLSYHNLKKTTAREMAKIVDQFIKKNPEMFFHKIIREQYDLEIIIKEKLIPLL